MPLMLLNPCNPWASFNRPGLELKLTLAQAEAVSVPGQDATEAVKALMKVPAVARQLARMDPAALAAELREYGAWDDEELKDHDANLMRLVWIAGGNINEERRERNPLLLNPVAITRTDWVDPADHAQGIEYVTERVPSRPVKLPGLPALQLHRRPKSAPRHLPAWNITDPTTGFSVAFGASPEEARRELQYLVRKYGGAAGFVKVLQERQAEAMSMISRRPNPEKYRGLSIEPYEGIQVGHRPSRVTHEKRPRLIPARRKISGWKVTDPEGHSRIFNTLAEARAWVDSSGFAENPCGSRQGNPGEVSGPFHGQAHPYGKVIMTWEDWYVTVPGGAVNIRRFKGQPRRFIVPSVYPVKEFKSLDAAVKWVRAEAVAQASTYKEGELKPERLVWRLGLKNIPRDKLMAMLADPLPDWQRTLVNIELSSREIRRINPGGSRRGNPPSPSGLRRVNPCANWHDQQREMETSRAERMQRAGRPKTALALASRAAAHDFSARVSRKEIPGDEYQPMPPDLDAAPGPSWREGLTFIEQNDAQRAAQVLREKYPSLQVNVFAVELPEGRRWRVYSRQKNPGEAWHRSRQEHYQDAAAGDLAAGHGEAAQFWKGAAAAESAAVAQEKAAGYRANPEAFYTIRPRDVGRSSIRAFGRSWPVVDFIGHVGAYDVGKRVYQRGDVLQVENQEQLEARLGARANPRAFGPPYSGPKVVHRWGLGEFSVQPIDPASGSKWDWEIRATVEGRTEIEQYAGNRATAEEIGKSLIERLEGGLSKEKKDKAYWQLYRRGNPGRDLSRFSSAELLTAYNKLWRRTRERMGGAFDAPTLRVSLPQVFEEMKALDAAYRRALLQEGAPPALASEQMPRWHRKTNPTPRQGQLGQPFEYGMVQAQKGRPPHDLRGRSAEYCRLYLAGYRAVTTPGGVHYLPPKDRKDNPTPRQGYRTFHQAAPDRDRQVKVPQGWPRKLWMLGKLKLLILKDGKRITGGTVAAGTGNRIYILNANYTGRLGPRARAAQIEYVTPRASQRAGPVWFHPFDSPPPVREAAHGFLTLAGQSMKLTDRGIVG